MKKLLFSIIALLGVVQARAYDCEVDDICYNLNRSTMTATVTYSTYVSNIFGLDAGNYGYRGVGGGNSLEGRDLVIPSTINCDGIDYTVVSIGDRAFATSQNAIDKGAVLMTSVTIPSTVTSIGERAFNNCTALRTISLPSSVTSIGVGAFNECNRLESITIPESVKTIGSFAFAMCYKLTSVNIPKSVRNIEQGVFNGCLSLTSITIPEGVTSIGDDVFYGCSNLASVTISSSVASIGRDAFSYCPSLTSVVMKRKAQFNIGDAFRNMGSNCRLTIPIGTRDAYIAAGWTTDVFNGGIVEAIDFADPKVKAICVANWDTNNDGELDVDEATAVTSLGRFFTDNKEITTFDELRYFTGLTAIGDSAFCGCSGLTSIVIPESVTSIGYRAFYCCI